MPRLARAVALSVAVLVALVLSVRAAKAGFLEVSAADATPAALNVAGFNGVTGQNVNVGVLEAGGGQPFTANIYLPNNIITIPNQTAGQAAQVVSDHATEVDGVIVAVPATPGNNRGIATGAIIQAASTVSGPTQFIQNSQRMVTGAPAGRAHIVNMSLSAPQADGNNALGLRPEWVDWAELSTAIPSSVAPADNLFVISAGNSGNDPTPANRFLNSPADAYNGITVGSTGIRNGAGNLVYTQFASYTSIAITGDKSPTTGLGRIKTDIVAPGGDPGPNSPLGTFGAPPANVNQFITTSGQRYEITNDSSAPPNRPVYQIDDFNGTGLTGTVGANVTRYALVGQNSAPLQAPPYPSSMTIAQANAFFNNTDGALATTLAGTSFAAPLVSGGAALLEQYGASQGVSTDHRVVKALLLNGASKVAPGGGPLLDLQGNIWGPALNPTNPANNKIFTEYPTQFAGYSNETINKADAYSGGNQPIKIGIDPQLGTGQMDVVASLKNYAAGQQAPGNVKPNGWDLRGITGYSGNNADAPPIGLTANINPSIRDYIFTSGPAMFSGTLTWDRLATLNDTNGNGVWDPAETFNATNATGAPGGQPLSDLDLQLFQLNPLNPLLGPATLVDFSTSDIDNIEHIFANLAGGIYELQVRDLTSSTIVSSDTYALAWSVPEPTSLVLSLLVLPIACVAARRIARRRETL
jgi:hypothetical protein